MNETENKKPDTDKHESHRRLSDALSEACQAKILLECVRSGKIAEVLEILESQLEISILHMHRHVDKVGTAERIRAIEILRQIGQYRLQHPRKTEAKLCEEENEDDSVRQSTWEKARKILDETLAAPSPMEKEINDVKAAFATLIEYQQTNDLRVFDLFLPDCPVTVINGKTQETLVWSQDDFREWVRQQIALKIKFNSTYEDVQYRYFGPAVLVFLFIISISIRYRALQNELHRLKNLPPPEPEPHVPLMSKITRSGTDSTGRYFERPSDMAFEVLKFFNQMPRNGMANVATVANQCGISQSDALTVIKELWNLRFIRTVLAGQGEWNGFYAITTQGEKYIDTHAT